MKHVLLFSFYVVAISAATAQNSSWGVKGGLNSAALNFSIAGSTVHADRLNAFHAGLYATIMTTEKFGVQPELMYSIQGSKVGSSDIKLGYLVIPFMFRYNIINPVSLQAGPQLGVLLLATDTGADASSQFSSLDFGLGMGAAVDLPLRLSLTVRYVIGLSNISAIDLETITGIPGNKLVINNRTLQASLGFRISGR